MASGFKLEIALSTIDDTCDDEIGDKGDVKIIEWTLTRKSRDRQCVEPFGSLITTMMRIIVTDIIIIVVVVIIPM